MNGLDVTLAEGDGHQGLQQHKVMHESNNVAHHLKLDMNYVRNVVDAENVEVDWSGTHADAHSAQAVRPQDIALGFKGLSVSAPHADATHSPHLLTDVTGFVVKGGITAVLGASGSGPCLETIIIEGAAQCEIAGTVTILMHHLTTFVRPACHRRRRHHSHLHRRRRHHAPGKSVLLKTLTGRLQHMHCTGEVTLDGRAINPHSQSNGFSFTPQEDLLIGDITCR
jgi:hypothetical protein